MKKIVPMMALALLFGCGESETENYSKEFTDHPLSMYFNPHGHKALMYFGNFRNICDKTHNRYDDKACDEAVERGIRIGKSVGIDLERNDLVNEVFWAKTQEVGNERADYYQKHVTSHGNAKDSLGEDLYWKASAEFEKKSNEYMKNMDENYGR